MSFEGRFFKPAELPPRMEGQPLQEPAEQHTPPAEETLPPSESPSHPGEGLPSDSRHEERHEEREDGPLSRYEQGVRYAGKHAADVAEDAFTVEAMLSIAQERGFPVLNDSELEERLSQFLEGSGAARDILKRLHRELTDIKVMLYRAGLQVTLEETREKFRDLEKQDHVPRKF